ncbi:macrophage expressed 1 [Cichlidogyrus casuarinus]|uniref:Macrophage-expressed gene 1 protein n=1 Tax=Cichlidogyrus casuarinus TaxID=1844966 RepID=A0ABD2Q9U2_9PLAT
MVAVNRVGRPIYEAINAIKVPELEPSLLKKVVEVLKSAVHRYYEANIVLGCMDPDSPVFDPNANAPSTTACSVSEESISKKGHIFGGTYQTCYGAYDLCKIHGRKHPLTGQYSCPSDYVPVRLLPTQVIGCVTWVDRGWLWNSYHEVCAYTEAFWCSPSDVHGKISDAYFFGGIFSDTFVNPVTGDKSCPDNFESLRLGKGLNLCASVDWKSGIAKSVPFGGLYACQSGNPMTPLIENYEDSTTRSGNVDSLNQIMFKSDSNSMLAPKRCPSGYVSHSAGLEDVCQISYCMPSDTFKNEKVQLIKSPPFIKLEGTSLSLSAWRRNDQCVLEPDQELLAVLPGSGWDNLLNQERPQVVDREDYAQCKLSTDRKFVVPDQMEIEPIKMTVTSFSSETFEDSSEYVDSTSNTINVNSGLPFLTSSISGSYSWEKTDVKKKQLSSKSIALRNQVRHRLYKVFLGPEAPLHKHFKKRILSISYLLDSPKIDISLLEDISKIDDYWLDQPGIAGNGEMLRDPVNPIANLSTSTPYMKAVEAAYMADLIIRDFGTHFITETENGAAIIQISYLKEKVRKMSEESRSSISKGASVAFSLGLNFTLDYSSEEKNSKINVSLGAR